jgi:hypothetical protein
VPSLTARNVRLGLATVLVATCISACSSTRASTSVTSTTVGPVGSRVATSDPAGEQSVCSRIDGIFYFPTVPAGGYTVSSTAAKEIETLLLQAHSTELHAQATLLRQAIDADDESGMVRVILHVEDDTCTPSGIPPAT